MLKQLLYKWFGLEDPPCASCELLRAQLEMCNEERKNLLERLLNPPKEEPAPTHKENLQPINPARLPWYVRQQMLEREDRKEAERIRKEKEKEIAETKPSTEQSIAEIEQELGVQENG